jgi:hypothetical protein
MRIAVLALMMALAAAVAGAAEPPALAKARSLYNAGDYDGAIAAAGIARTQLSVADAAALVEARARLQRYRGGSDAADLTSAREALGAVRSSLLVPRDQVDFLIGLGQSLYLSNLYGAAAELFNTALQRALLLPERDRLTLVDWWATALDREAQGAPADRRIRLAGEITARMQEELRRDPASAPANYWLAAAARGAGDLDAAWDASVAGWVRATLDPMTAASLRSDIDRLVTEALIPERARARPGREQADASDAMRAQWESIKQEWK